MIIKIARIRLTKLKMVRVFLWMILEVVFLFFEGIELVSPFLMRASTSFSDKPFSSIFSLYHDGVDGGLRCKFSLFMLLLLWYCSSLLEEVSDEFFQD